jgi:hypothetical protein
LLAVFSKKVLHVPNFCPECGSSQATSRFCSSCGYSLAATPAPPDASTRVEDTPALRPFAQPVVETWGNLAADPWSSNASAVAPPPVRNVVTQTPVDVSETKLTAVKWLWRIFLLATIAYGFVAFPSFTGEPVSSTAAHVYVLGVLALVALLTMTAVAASAIAAITLGWLISPEYWADVEIASLYDKGLDRRILYGVALLVQSLAVYVVALAPVVALSKALSDRYSGDVFKSEPSGVSWASVWFSALAVSAYDVITAGLVFRAWWVGWESLGISLAILIGSLFLFLWALLDFKTRSDIVAARAKKQVRLAKQQAKHDAERPSWENWFVKILLGLLFVTAVVTTLLLNFG